MKPIYILLIVATSLVVLPVLAYLVMKFGVAGYLRGRAKGGMSETETYEKQK